MGSSFLCRAVVAALAAGSAIPLAGQEGPYRLSPNPYQEEVPYRIGQELTPNVDVDGVRWLRAAVAPREDRDPEPGVDSTVLVDLRFENTGREGATVIVVLLLEDEQGSQLDRLACPEMRIGGDRAKDARHKMEVAGDALLATRQVYLFLRVQR